MFLCYSIPDHIAMCIRNIISASLLSSLALFDLYFGFFFSLNADSAKIK